MPFVAPIIPLIAAAATAIPTIKGLFGGHGSSAPQQAVKPPQQDLTSQKEAILAAAPSVQERLGGAVAPEFFASEVARVSGNPQDTALAEQVLNLSPGLGGSSTIQPGLGSSTIGSGNISGTPAQPAQGAGAGSSAAPNFFESILHGLGGGGGGGSANEEMSGGYI